MAWAKLDDAMCFHEKVVEAGNAAVGVWARLISWSAQHLTDGVVPEHVAKLVAGESRGALRALEQAGLVRRQPGDPRASERANTTLRRSQSNARSPGVYVIHDYLDYNPSRAEVEGKREKERVRKGKNSARNPPGRDAASAPPDPTRTRPDPSAQLDYNAEVDGSSISVGEIFSAMQEWPGWPTPTGLTRKATDLAKELGGTVTKDELDGGRFEAERINGQPNLGLLLSVILRHRKERQAFDDGVSAIIEEGRQYGYGKQEE